MTKSKLQAACPQRARPGLTLVELLVVVMIMAIMLAVAVPIVRPPVEARTVREAARMVNTALASARTRAIQTGRPVGVMFEPFDAEGKTAAVLHYVQVAAPYAGSSTNSRITFTGAPVVINDPRNDPADPSYDENAPERKLAECDYSMNAADPAYLTPGSQLKLGYKKPAYVIRKINGDTLTLAHPTIEWADSLSYWPVTGQPLPFQLSPPPKKSSLFPLQLPTRAVVDLGASGEGLDGKFILAADTPVMVTFAPTGKVERIYHSGAAAGAKLTEPLYLLVGKPGKTAHTASDKEENNLLDGDNIWIKLDYRTGAVCSAENNPAIDVTDLEQALKDARTWAEGN